MKKNERKILSKIIGQQKIVQKQIEAFTLTIIPFLCAKKGKMKAKNNKNTNQKKNNIICRCCCQNNNNNNNRFMLYNRRNVVAYMFE